MASRHSFSIEMTSREHVKGLSMTDDARAPVVFEGELGEIVGISIVEDLMLELKGANGVLRIDMMGDEFERLCGCDACALGQRKDCI